MHGVLPSLSPAIGYGTRVSQWSRENLLRVQAMPGWCVWMRWSCVWCSQCYTKMINTRRGAGPAAAATASAANGQQPADSAKQPAESAKLPYSLGISQIVPGQTREATPGVSVTVDASREASAGPSVGGHVTVVSCPCIQTHIEAHMFITVRAACSDVSSLACPACRALLCAWVASRTVRQYG